MNVKRLVAYAAIFEAATGLLLFAFPALVVRLLCGWGITGSSVALSRFLGIGLFSLAIACRPMERFAQQLFGMLTYTVLAALYLMALGVTGNTGILLWPAVAAHGALGLALGSAWLRRTRQEF